MGHRATSKGALLAVVLQIMVIDIVFSLDSVITAVGMTPHVPIMMVAVVIAAGDADLLRADQQFRPCHPTIKMLALAFLILIGVMLVGEAFGQHIEKGYIYFAMAFSLRRVAEHAAAEEGGAGRTAALVDAGGVQVEDSARQPRPRPRRAWPGGAATARLDAADDRLARHGDPVAAVGAAVSVVAHRHVVGGRYGGRTPVLVAAEVHRHVAVVQLTALP